MTEQHEPEVPPETQPSESKPAAETAPDETLLVELEAARRQSAEYLEMLQRLQADFSNYRKRVEQEFEDLARATRARIIQRFLPILDDFEWALKHRPTNGSEANWAEGIALIYRKLWQVLEAEGLKKVEPVGAKFDPWEHEAVATEETEAAEDGQILEVLRPGYKLDHRVIRPAQVKVARRPARPAETEAAPGP
ncbi:MAG: nucleotide exchange factor GrpE [Chloroflexota bacterium]